MRAEPMSAADAEPHIARARRQLERVQVAASDPADAEEAVTWAFYAYENCVVALAELHDRKWKKTTVRRRSWLDNFVPTAWFRETSATRWRN